MVQARNIAVCVQVKESDNKDAKPLPVCPICMTFLLFVFLCFRLSSVTELVKHLPTTCSPQYCTTALHQHFTLRYNSTSHNIPSAKVLSSQSTVFDKVAILIYLSCAG